MKKGAICLLGVVLLWSATFAAAKEAWPQEEELYGKEIIGYVSGWTPQEWLGDSNPVIEDELIFVVSPYMDCWLAVPDGRGQADEYIGTGVQFVLEGPPVEQASEDAQELSFYRPVSLEVVGKMTYGGIVEIGADFVVLEAYADGLQVRVAIDENTVGYRGDLPYTIQMGKEVVKLFEIGTSCEIVYDDETGIALTLREAHG